MAKPLIIIEGDSWERLPNFGAKGLPTVGGTSYDLSRALADLGYPIENLAYWGDTLAAISVAKDYLRALTDTKAKYLLLGGGGNDLLGGGRLQSYLRVYQDGLAAADYLKPNFELDFADVIARYRLILNEIYEKPHLSDVTVIVHGYDYARPMKLCWIGGPMEQQGINDDHPDLQIAIVKVIIDRFNAELKALKKTWKKVVYVDFRGKVGDRWHDELHPEKEAFADLAKMLVKKAGL